MLLRLLLIIAVWIVEQELYPTVVTQVMGQEFQPVDFLFVIWFRLHMSSLAFQRFRLVE